MAGAEPPRGPETELSEGRQGAAEAFGGGFWPGFLDEVAKDFFFFPGVPPLAPRRRAKYSLSLAYFGGLLEGT